MKSLITLFAPDSQISFAELCSCVNLSTEAVMELIAYEIIAPVAGSQPGEWQFHITAIGVANKALRLSRDLNIDWADIALVLNLLQEIERLKNENQQLKQQLNRFLL